MDINESPLASGEADNFAQASAEFSNQDGSFEDVKKDDIEKYTNDNRDSEDVKPSDPYLYTKREEFTSEIFKIELQGLPPKFGYGELKKLLNKTLHLKSHKLKAIGPKSSWAFVTFRCEEDRTTALATLEGYKWKGRTLTAKKANPAADPLIKKRQNSSNELNVGGEQSGNKKPKLEDEDLPVDVRLKNVVMPLWNVKYEDQIKNKEKSIKKILVKLGRQIEKVCGYVVPSWLIDHRKKCDFMCCAFEGVQPSPVVDGYRNKCEFTVGWDPERQQKMVGFRLERYSAGSMSVGNASECTIVSQKILAVAKAFEEYVRKSEKDPYNPEDHSGHWRQLTVKITRKDDIMAVVVMHPQTCSRDELDVVKSDLADYFWNGSGKNCGLTSLYFHTFSTRGTDQLEYVCGDKYIQETLLDLQFRISPTAFFQINTAGAELLYAALSDMIDVKTSTTLLDICCGTGTIGLCLAKKVHSVVGIEMVPDAVEDAKQNAAANGVTNIEFHCGKVEDILSLVIFRLNSEDVVAVVDPPRAGLHNKVIKTIRGCKQLHRLVYVSCDPAAAMSNFVDLCRPESNQYRGRPFLVKKAIAVDLFPHTLHCELLILMERDIANGDTV